MNNYLQKPFDKPFIKVVEELYSTRAKHGMFTKRKELLQCLGIIDSNYAAIRKFERGVPAEKYDSIKRHLKEHYAINPEYLDGKSLDMFLRVVPVGSNNHHDNSSNNVTKIDMLLSELESKNDLLVEKERFINFQQKTIDLLKSQVDRLQTMVEQLTKK